MSSVLVGISRHNYNVISLINFRDFVSIILAEILILSEYGLRGSAEDGLVAGVLLAEEGVGERVGGGQDGLLSEHGLVGMANDDVALVGARGKIETRRRLLDVPGLRPPL